MASIRRKNNEIEPINCNFGSKCSGRSYGENGSLLELRFVLYSSEYYLILISCFSFLFLDFHWNRNVNKFCCELTFNNHANPNSSNFCGIYISFYFILAFKFSLSSKQPHECHLHDRIAIMQIYMHNSFVTVIHTVFSHSKSPAVLCAKSNKTRHEYQRKQNCSKE